MMQELEKALEKKEVGERARRVTMDIMRPLILYTAEGFVGLLRDIDKERCRIIES